jgi:hypothetical protein
MVGYAANPGPGENRNGSTTGNGTYDPNFDNKSASNYGQQKPADYGMNVIGFNDPAKIGSIGAQGGILSRTLNQVPFINATAGLHDYMFNSNPELNFTLWNVPSMVPAAALSIPAALNNPSFSWITQIKRPLSTKPESEQSVIRVDSNLLPSIGKKNGMKK